LHKSIFTVVTSFIIENYSCINMKKNIIASKNTHTIGSFWIFRCDFLLQTLFSRSTRYEKIYFYSTNVCFQENCVWHTQFYYSSIKSTKYKHQIQFFFAFFLSDILKPIDCCVYASFETKFALPKKLFMVAYLILSRNWFLLGMLAYTRSE